MATTQKILIVSGEASGDLHAAALVNQIKALRPDTTFFGLGGKKSQAAGVELSYDIMDLAVVGLFEVLRNLRTFKKIFDSLLGEADRRKPDVAILVDYPGFNLRLAGELKKRKIPVIYYISPQIWAWGAGRIKEIHSVVDLMLVVFAFEEGLYRRHGVEVSFVGHPLLDSVKPTVPPATFRARNRLDPKKTTIALLPGSRAREVKLLLPIMVNAAKLIYRARPDTQFLILRSATVSTEIFEQISAACALPLVTVTDATHDGLSASDFALVCSGTATLETAIIGVPMVILYKISFFTWAYMRAAIKIPYIGLVNVVRQRKFIEEFIQYDAQPEKIAAYILGLLRDPARLGAIKRDYQAVVQSLGPGGASERAGRVIVDFLDSKL